MALLFQPVGRDQLLCEKFAATVFFLSQDLHGGQLVKISSQAEDDFIRLNLLWTGFFGETCERRSTG